MEPMFLVIGESVAGGRRIYRFGPVNGAASFTRACAGDGGAVCHRHLLHPGRDR